MPRPPIERWKVAADPEPLPGGHRNLAYRTVGLDREVVFKSTRRTLDAIKWLNLVHAAARQSGVIVPDLIESAGGRLVEDGWTCETLIRGRPFSSGEMPDVLPLITRFHEVTASLPQRPGFLSSQYLLTASAGGDVDLSAMPDDLVARCRTAWWAVSDRPEAVIHGDLNPTNVIRCPDGRIGLIDWDECRRDLTLFDLGPLRDGDDRERRARLAWEAACSWVIEPDYAREVASRL